MIQGRGQNGRPVLRQRRLRAERVSVTATVRYDPIGGGMIVTDAGGNAPKPIRGPYPEFAKRVRALVGSASLRAVAAKTRVNFSTVGSMMDGFRGSPESTDKLARAYGVNPNELRRMVGYPAVPEYEQHQQPAKEQEEGGGGGGDADDSVPVILPNEEFELIWDEREPPLRGRLSARDMRILREMLRQSESDETGK